MLNRKWLSIGSIIIIIGLIFANTPVIDKISKALSHARSPSPTVIAAKGTIEVAFSPNNGATQTIIKAIAEAKQSILVSAYSFTSKDIANALVTAKNRGVAVKIILDKSQVGRKYSSSTFFANQGFLLRIDVKHAIYHDKVMIIDDKTVVTGSFNFTKAAEAKNAENVLILRDNPELAKLYADDWWANWQQAVSRTEFLNKYQSIKSTEDE